MYNVVTQPSGEAPSSSEIIDGKVYIGNLSANLDAGYRAGLGITHIVSVCTDCTSTGPNHLVIAVDDNEYEDILAHIPKAIAFIDRALEEDGRVLVHCVMGVSRSATIVAAYLMKTREWDVMKALEYIKARRPQVHPNYGFFKQLQIYVKCQYNPKPTDRSWKRRYTQDVTRYLGYVDDVGTIVKDRLCMMSEFPDDPEQGRWLLQEFMFTDVLLVGSNDVRETAEELGLKLHSVDAGRETWLKSELPGACRAISKALDGDGCVLVYSESETKASLVVCAYLMASRHVSPQVALETLQGSLQLFTPSTNFLRQLQTLSDCAFKWLQDEDGEEEIEEAEPVPVQVSPPKNRSDSFSKAFSSMQEMARERVQAASRQGRSPQLRVF